MSFSNIIGYENEKKELRRIAGMLKNIKNYRDKGLKLSRGLLLTGAPGVGKSAMARAMADEGITLVELRAADCCGDGLDEAVHQAFEQAKEQKPSILLLDELDKIAGTSMEFFMENNDGVKKILLQELDALTDEDEVLVVGTCNEYECLGDALTRTGRFDHTLSIGLPDQETRKKILRFYFRQIKLKHCYNLDDLARLTCGFSCSDLQCLANETGIQVVDKGKKSIHSDDVIAVMNRLNFQGAQKEDFDDEEVSYRVAVHEAGHALTAMLLCPDSLYGASILPQGDSLGHVRMMESKEKKVSVSDIKNEICVSLAGRVAEREILGEIYLGSESDLQTATRCLLMIMTSHAAYGYRHLLCNMPMFPGAKAESVQNGAADLFDREMNAMDEKITQMIRENRELFDSIVRNLVNERALSKEQLFRLMESCKAVKAA